MRESQESLLQEDILILHKRKIGSHAASPFIPYSTNRSRDPMYTFVFEVWNILLLMLLVEEVRKNRMNHEYPVITSLWTLILLFVKFIPTIE